LAPVFRAKQRFECVIPFVNSQTDRFEFKHALGCRHLLSHCDNGIELQTYAAIIACLLIALRTGRKPTLSTYRMLCWYFSGWADDEELLTHINKLRQQDVLKKNELTKYGRSTRRPMPALMLR